MIKPFISAFAVTIFIAASFSVPVAADVTPVPVTPTKPSNDLILIRLRPTPRNERPHAPSRVFLNCSYSASSGMMWLDGVESDEIAVAITGLTSGFTAEYTAAPGEPFYVGTIAEDVQVVCTTAHNQIFEGTILLSDLK